VSDKIWYDKFHAAHETDEFNEWWETAYGPVALYSDDEGEQDEYWTRKGFSLLGWLARGDLL
jgi:hypothetical protein